MAAIVVPLKICFSQSLPCCDGAHKVLLLLLADRLEREELAIAGRIISRRRL